MAKTKPRSKLFDLETYADQRKVTYRLLPGDSNGEMQEESVQVPFQIALRLYHLARAFDGQAIKLIQPGCASRIDFFQLQRLISEMEVVSEVVNEPVSQHYLESLLPLLKKGQGMPGCVLRADEE